MSITWYNEQPKDIVVTLTPLNLTINKPGIIYFDNAHQVMLGYDQDDSKILIKPLTKNEAIRGDIPDHAKYNITIHTSYGRITNKSFMAHMDQLFDLNLTEKGLKYKAVWSASTRVLEVFLKEEK